MASSFSLSFQISSQGIWSRSVLWKTFLQAYCPLLLPQLKNVLRAASCTFVTLQLWNEISEEIHQCSSVSAFLEKCKIHQFAQDFAGLKEMVLAESVMSVMVLLKWICCFQQCFRLLCFATAFPFAFCELPQRAVKEEYKYFINFINKPKWYIKIKNRTETWVTSLGIIVQKDARNKLY